MVQSSQPEAIAIPAESHPSAHPRFSPTRKARLRDIRVANRMIVFNHLFPRTELSRSDLSGITHLSKASVSEVVQELLDARFLTETGERATRGRGKRATLLAVDSRWWSVIVVDVSQSYMIVGARLTLDGTILDKQEIAITDHSDITEERIVDLCNRLIGDSATHVLGIGICVPGIIDDHGNVLNSANLRWSNVPLQKELQASFSAPVFVTHDTTSSLLAERFYEHAPANMLFISISLGVGAGIMFDNHPVKGMNDSAGEIGHVTLDPNGPHCSCGKNGCLEAYVSVPVLRHKIADNPSDRTRILQHAGEELGTALVSTVNLLDFNDIVLSGPPDIVNSILVDSTEETLNRLGPVEAVHERTVHRSQFGDDINLLGEGIAVLQHNLAAL